MEQIQLIKHLIPNFNITSYNMVAEGANSLAIKVNNEYIFRFPLKENDRETQNDYKREFYILNTINPYIKTISIPKIEIYESNNIVFTKHKIIEGASYITLKQNLQLKKNVAKSLAGFLKELHSIPTNLLDVKRGQFDYKYYEIDDNSLLLLKSLYGDSITNDIKKSMDFLDNYNNFNEKDDVICHNDLHEENIIINNNKLNGIIDFANVVIKKRDNDLADLLPFDYELTLLLIKEYEKITNYIPDLNYIYHLQFIKCCGYLVWFVKNKKEKYVKIFTEYVKNMLGECRGILNY